MKTCRRLLDFVQIINAEGDVRLCSWNTHNIVGNLIDDDFETILNSDAAKKLRTMIANGNYSYCPADNCPYQANDNMDEILVEYDEDNIHYPEGLMLAYEGNCNYNCTCCSSHQHMVDTRNNDYREQYDILEERIKPILPHVKKIGANGRGELFASPRILKLLSEWEPASPPEEITVSLETNGSLFNEQNWEKIKNLGNYNLRVCITIMSFNEAVYQYLSGSSLPMSKVEESLKFVKSLREKGVINYLELATVFQELNFLEMPSFTRRCIEEFGADVVRLRPLFPGGPLDANTQWFMNIRNSEHPYHSVYKKVMQDEIFKNEKVLLWSGDMDDDDVVNPYRDLEAQTEKDQKILSTVKSILTCDGVGEKLRIDNAEKIMIYGLGAIGRTLVNSLQQQTNIIICDNVPKEDEYKGIKVLSRPDIDITDIDAAIVCAYGTFTDVKNWLNGLNPEIRVIDIFDNAF